MKETDLRGDLAPAGRVAALEQSLRARTFELEVLHDLSRTIGASQGYEELFRAILPHLGNVIAYDVAASLLFTGGAAGCLYLRRARPLAPAVQAEVENRLREALGRLGATCALPGGLEVVHTEEAPEGQAPAPHAAPVERLGSFFQVPIIARPALGPGPHAAQGVAVGLIFVGAEAAGQFTEEHIRLLYTVANQASAAVQRMQAFQEAERLRLRTVVEHLPDAVLLLEQGGRVVMANPASQKFLELLPGVCVGRTLAEVGGRPLPELVGRPPQDFVPPGPPPRVVEAHAIALGQDPPGGGGWLLVLRDVTEVREAVRRRDHFLAMLSHELRNPLAAISSAVHLLHVAPGGEQGTAGQVQGEARDTLRRQAGHLARLVDDLLDMSRFLHGKIHVVKGPVDLAELAGRAAQPHLAHFQAEGKEFVLDVAPGPLTVEGDAARLTQVVDNLLSNARKFTPPGGQVHLTCRAEGGAAVLRVRDTGVGVPADKHAEIFEPFTQAEQSIDRSQGGLGLGLALVKGLVERHDGTVRVYSEGPGAGSEFVVRLPLRAAATPAGSGQDKRQGPTPRRRILLVEDEPDAREMLAAVLRLEGHQVTVASSGPEGVAAFTRQPPDVALIDIGLPGMDGYSVVRALRRWSQQESPGCAARLVALSGYAQPEDRRRALEAGFDEHLAKPLQMSELGRILRSEGFRKDEG
jgi:signal transduction histidine kinase/CheY-like chemotaxis protein